jgi:hypothetical protein
MLPHSNKILDGTGTRQGCWTLGSHTRSHRASPFRREAKVNLSFGSGGWKAARRATREHVSPDTTAAIFWLKNRKPVEWRDRQQFEHAGAGGGAIEITWKYPTEGTDA